MKARVSVAGLKELGSNLGLLKKSVARNVLRRVLMKAGQPIADTASRLAPDDPATSAPDLHTSISVSTKIKNTAGNAEFAAAMKAGEGIDAAVSAMRGARRAAAGEGSFAEVYVGPEAGQFHGSLQEFGTVNHPPQPFMRPAFDQHKGEALEIIKAELAGEISKAVARMQRSAARKAARAAKP